MKAIILAAGLGTRLRPLTDSCPKALLPVNGKPMLERWIEILTATGVDKIAITAYHHADMIHAFVNSIRSKVSTSLIVSDERPLLLDTGGGIARALSLLDISDKNELVVIVNADILTDFNISALVDHMQSSLADAILLVNPLRVTRRKLLFNCEDMRMVGWLDSASMETRSPFLDLKLDSTICEAAFAGIHAVRGKFIDTLISYRQPLTPFNIINFYIEACSNACIKGFISLDRYSWVDIGKPEVYNSLTQ
ncbi:MAG: NTP transferase domain-containing protein [Bacteroides sp.]|nr:NTP transferase domain-containing protein [Bacteroides sp.]